MIPLVLALAAQASAACEDGAYSTTMFQDDLTSADAALRRSDLGAAKKRLQSAGQKLLCLDTVVNSEDLGKFSRQLALVTFFSQDEVAAVRWGMLSQIAAPELPWHVDYGRGHPFRELMSRQNERPVGGPTNVALNPPKKGAIFIDGVLALEPRAAAEVPHLVQMFDDRAKFVGAYWQDGAAFPDAVVIASDDPKIKPPAWYKGDTSNVGGSAAALQVSMAPAAAGAGLLVVSGILYAIGSGAKGGLGDATEASELTALRSRANWMVVGSSATALAGVGLGVTAVLVNDQRGVAFSVRF